MRSRAPVASTEPASNLVPDDWSAMQLELEPDAFLPLFGDPASPFSPRIALSVTVVAISLRNDLVRTLGLWRHLHPDAPPHQVIIGDEADRVLAGLPPIVRAECTVSWVEAFQRCYAHIGATIQAGAIPTPRCVGDEMALHLCFVELRRTWASRAGDSTEQWYGLPPHPADEHLDTALAHCVGGMGVLTLFARTIPRIDPWDRLAPARWFEPHTATTTPL